MSENEGEQTRPVGIRVLMAHIANNRVDFALWTIRLVTIALTLNFVFPFGGSSPQSLYYKILMANAATSALRLHQRVPQFRFDRAFLVTIFREDSAHYLFYSLVFIFCAPLSFVVLPIFLFALLHFASYTSRLADSLGANSVWLVRMLVSLVEVQSANILRMVALTEILLMPMVVMMTFRGAASLVAPFAYYRFLAERYASQRNPYSRTMFHELRATAEHVVAKPACPTFIRGIVSKIIALVCRLAPQH